MGSCVSIAENQYAVVTTHTTRTIHTEPTLCFSVGALESVQVFNSVVLNHKEFVVITNEKYPEKNRVVTGPAVVSISDPWETVSKPKECVCLDQDDYLVVTDIHGVKKTIQKEGIYRPNYGDSYDKKSNAIIVPLNHYIIVHDTNDSAYPVKHIRGPTKFIPEPFQTLITNSQTSSYHFPCLCITENQAVHIKTVAGDVVMFSTSGYYMPEVGETKVKDVPKTILLDSEFCVIKAHTGTTYLMDGSNPQNRAFFLQPFHEFVVFKENGTEFTVLSKQPKIIPIKYSIKTSDGVTENLDVRVTYRIRSPETFTRNPIDYYNMISTWVQNDLLDRFADMTLRTFYQNYNKSAHEACELGSKYFEEYGIIIDDVQIISFDCPDQAIRDLLATEIQTTIRKENEMKAKKAEVELRKTEVEIAEANRIVEITKSDTELKLNTHKIENQIKEEELRVKLLEAIKANAVKEAEFEGRARGMVIKQFMDSLPRDLTQTEKMKVWDDFIALEKAMVYASSGTQFYPEGSKFKLNLGGHDAKDSKLYVPSILGYDNNKK